MAAEMVEAMMDKPLKIMGVLATPRVSRNMNLYLPSELERAVKKLGDKFIPIYLEHVDVQNAIGRAKLIWNPEKLQVEFIGEILDPDVADKIKHGLIKHVSLGADYERIDQLDGVNVIRGLEFRELSLVAVPGIPEANIQVVESADGSYVFSDVEIKVRNKLAVENAQPEMTQEEAKVISHETTEKASERVVPFEATKKAPVERDWDDDRARMSLRKWASSDGSGDPDKIDWSKYARGFAWYDAENRETLGAYKLPHHEVIDGELCVVWRGVVAAMAALMGARGGVDIPTDERRGVYNHLAKHYEQFEREPPSFEFLQAVSESCDPETIEKIASVIFAEIEDEEVNVSKNISCEKLETEMSQEIKVEEVKVEEVKALPTHAEEAVEKENEEKKVSERHAEIFKKLKEAVTGVPTGYLKWSVDVYPVPAALPVDLTKFADVKTIKKGQGSAKFYKIASLTFTSVTEGTEQSESSQAISVVEITPAKYGAVQVLTDSQMDRAEVDIIAAVENTMKNAAFAKFNELILTALDDPTQITNVVYGGGKTSEDALTASDVLTLSVVAAAKRKILESKIACDVGDLVLVISPKQYYDLLQDANVMKAVTQEPAAFFKDALEMILGCRIVVSDQVRTGTGSGTPPITTYHAVMFKAKEAVGLAVEKDLEIEPVREGAKRQTKFVGTISAGAKVLVPEAACRIITA
ncbi:MAG: phage capsid protein [Nitrososphaerota archaeon]